MTTVASMYLDDPRVVCLSVRTDHDVPFLPELASQPQIIQVGFSRTREDFDVSFYDSVGLPFDVRWSKFHVNRNPQAEEVLMTALGLTSGDNYVVVHNTASTGKFSLCLAPETQLIKVENKTSNLLDWCGVIENAKEVHCVDSSVIHLAQCLKIKKGVFHNIRKTSSYFKLKEEWEIIEYT